MSSPPPGTVDILSILKLPWHHQLSTARMASCHAGTHSLTKKRIPSFSFIPLDMFLCSLFRVVLSPSPPFPLSHHSVSPFSFLLPLIFPVFSLSSMLFLVTHHRTLHFSSPPLLTVLVIIAPLGDSLTHLSSSPCVFFFCKPLLLKLSK